MESKNKKKNNKKGSSLDKYYKYVLEKNNNQPNKFQSGFRTLDYYLKNYYETFFPQITEQDFLSVWNSSHFLPNDSVNYSVVDDSKDDSLQEYSTKYNYTLDKDSDNNSNTYSTDTYSTGYSNYNNPVSEKNGIDDKIDDSNGKETGVNNINIGDDTNNGNNTNNANDTNNGGTGTDSNYTSGDLATGNNSGGNNSGNKPSNKPSKGKRPHKLYDSKLYQFFKLVFKKKVTMFEIASGLILNKDLWDTFFKVRQNMVIIEMFYKKLYYFYSYMDALACLMVSESGEVSLDLELLLGFMNNGVSEDMVREFFIRYISEPYLKQRESIKILPAEFFLYQ